MTIRLIVDYGDINTIFFRVLLVHGQAFNLEKPVRFRPGTRRPMSTR